MNADLFEGLPELNSQQICLDDGAILLRGFAKNIDTVLMSTIEKVVVQSPFRHMITPGGFRMSVAMSNCGQVGWIADRSGYRYGAIDPKTGRPWPALPEIFIDISRRAAMRAGYENFLPDACLINCYEPGARLSLHQDKNERDVSAPIVSVSLGLPAVFLFGGLGRTIRPKRYQLAHGDVVVWCGSSRFNFHGIAPLLEGYHPILGSKRINLTFRKAL